MSRSDARDLPLLDVLRLLASFAIVRHHVRGDLLFGIGFGLPLFLVILFGLTAGGERVVAFGTFARRRAGYLLTPWVRWSLLYVLVLALADLARSRPVGERFEPAMAFYGGHPSLWFLPFAAVAVLPVEWLRCRTLRLPAEAVAGAACLLAALSTFAVTRLLRVDLPDLPTRAWLRVSPALFYGLALGVSRRAGPEARLRILTLTALSAALTWWLQPSAAVAGAGAGEDIARRFGAAVPLVCLGFAWQPRVPALVRGFATTTFGIYLVHPLVGKALGETLDVFAWPAWLHAALAWGLAWIIVQVLRGSGLRWHELTARRHRVARGVVGSAVQPSARRAA